MRFPSPFRPFCYLCASMFNGDPTFIARLQQGERESFHQLYEAFQDKIYNTLYGLVQDEDDALDLSQEVFIEIYRSIAQFRGQSSLSTWIYRISVNKALNHLQSKKSRPWFRKKAALPDGSDHSLRIPDERNPDPVTALQNKELKEILRSAIASLPERQRVAFVLHKLEDLPYKEIAQVMRISLSSVESLIHRAKENLQKAILDRQ